MYPMHNFKTLKSTSLLEADGPLDIDDVTGQVVLTRPLDFEDQYYYEVTVTAFDLGTPSITSTVTIVLTVQPSNEHDPVWISGTNITVSEDTPPGRRTCT